MVPTPPAIAPTTESFAAILLGSPLRSDLNSNAANTKSGALAKSPIPANSPGIFVNQLKM